MPPNSLGWSGHRGEVIGSGWVGWWVGSLVGGGWLVVGQAFNLFGFVCYGGATSPEVEPTLRAFLTVRYGQNKRHRRQTASGCEQETPRC